MTSNSHVCEQQRIVRCIVNRIGHCFFFFNYLFIYFGLCWVFVVALGLSPVAVSEGCSPAAVLGLLLAVPSFIAEHRLQ